MNDLVDAASVELRRISLPLVAPFRTSFGTQSERDVLLVRVTTADGGEGWGECVAMADPLYSSEYVGGAQDVIERFLLPRLLAAGPIAPTQVPALLADVQGHRMAKAAVEMAWLDAGLRQEGRPWLAAMGATRTRVPCGVSVGIQESIPRLLDVVEDYLDQGYVRIKLKIEPGWDVEPVTAVREKFGDIPLQTDANAAYTLDDVDVLRRMDDLDLLLVEQPFPEEQVLAHARLREQITTPVCLDESIVSAQVCADAMEMGAVDIVNIKPGRVGGYLEARRIHELCLERGIPVWCGGMVETGLGRAANLALAAGEGFALPGDTSASERFFARDIITEPFVLAPDGHIDVPSGPGLGVQVDLGFVEEITTGVSVVGAS